MKKSVLILCACLICLMLVGISVSAETGSRGVNVLIPVENPKKYKGKGEIVRITSNDFDATRINDASSLIIRYEKLAESPDDSPVRLVLVNGKGNASPMLASPESFNENRAVFSGRQISEAFGADDLTDLTDISVVGTNRTVTVQSVQFTDVASYGTRPPEADPYRQISMYLVIGVIAGAVMFILIVLFFYMLISMGIKKRKANKTVDS